MVFQVIGSNHNHVRRKCTIYLLSFRFLVCFDTLFCARFLRFVSQNHPDTNSESGFSLKNFPLQIKTSDKPQLYDRPLSHVPETTPLLTNQEHLLALSPSSRYQSSAVCLYQVSRTEENQSERLVLQLVTVSSSTCPRTLHHSPLPPRHTPMNPSSSSATSACLTLSHHPKNLRTL